MYYGILYSTCITELSGKFHGMIPPVLDRDNGPRVSSPVRLLLARRKRLHRRVRLTRSA